MSRHPRPENVPMLDRLNAHLLEVTHLAHRLAVTLKHQHKDVQTMLDAAEHAIGIVRSASRLEFDQQTTSNDQKGRL